RGTAESSPRAKTRGLAAAQGFDMTKDDFRIGSEFYTAAGKWRCTDIGTRFIVAIRLKQDDGQLVRRAAFCCGRMGL
ncbi:MAG TPA: hypothetical protein PL105_25095, partial [Caldilineaceae bacterium]|nr:hypothetical protein [Caldilineaceae bacterium]